MESYFLKCPIEHLQFPLDAANAVTGLLINHCVGDTPARVKTHYYIGTQAASGQLIDIGFGATANAHTTNIVDGASAVTGAQGGHGETIAIVSQIVPANNFITAFNVATNTATIGTGIVGYIDLEIERFPVIVGDQ